MAIKEESEGMGGKSGGPEAPTLFLRKATGLVRGWSVRDAIIYACLSTNIITLGIYEFSFNSFIPKGQLLTAVLISGVWVSFLVIAYTGLIVTIPRAGGDYVWQSRILGGPVGFVFATTGWWFILWLWAPIYGTVLNVELFQPVLYTIGAKGAASYFGTHNGTMTICIITIALAGFFVSLGMNGYAKLQKWCFAGGMVGFVVIVILLLAYSHGSFVSSVNLEAHKYFGVSNAYGATTAAAAKLSYAAPAFGLNAFGASMLLVPMLMFYLLWPNWGSTLYGEVRGASDFKRVFSGMFAGLWLTVLLSVIFLLLMLKTFGWSFYNDANAVFWAGKGAIPIWPYPMMLASWLVHNAAFQVILLLVMSLWFFGWVGSLFLSSTRVIFAAAFDRVLPDAAASVSEKRKVPIASLLLMLLPAVALSAVYSYWVKFATLHLGRDTRHRGHLSRECLCRRHLALAQARAMGLVGREQVQDLWHTHRAIGGARHDGARHLQPGRVAFQQRLWGEQPRIAGVHGDPVCVGDRRLRRRAHDQKAPGHRPRTRQ